MRALVCLIMSALSLLAAGCHEIHVHTTEPVLAGEGLEPGDRVVARWGDGFWDATVITVQGRLVTVAWDAPPPDRSHVSSALVSLQGPSPVEVDQWALCPKAEPGRRALCQVVKIEGGDVTAWDAELGVERRVAADELLALPEGARRRAEGQGQLARARAGASERLKGVGPASAGAPVEVGQPVIAQWSDGNWWDARVVEIRGHAVVAAWADGSPAMPLSTVQVAPIQSRPEALIPDALALCRRQADTRWWRALITERRGESLSVIWIDGAPGQPPLKDCVPAAPTPARPGPHAEEPI